MLTKHWNRFSAPDPLIVNQRPNTSKITHSKHLSLFSLSVDQSAGCNSATNEQIARLIFKKCTIIFVAIIAKLCGVFRWMVYLSVCLWLEFLRGLRGEMISEFQSLVFCHRAKGWKRGDEGFAGCKGMKGKSWGFWKFE